MPDHPSELFRYATRRNHDLATRGGKVAVIGKALGRPLIPWQQYVADVATEVNPPGSRLLWRYPLVVILMPRQTGKTTLLRPVLVERAISRRQQIFTTAQLGKDATERWNDLVEDIENGPLAAQVRVKRSQGHERCTFPNGSFISPFAPGKKALHGYSPPTVLVDEAWAFSAAEGDDLMTAIRPAQITKRDRQLWIISAAGTAESEWLLQLVAEGRESVTDPRSQMAYFEASADPHADPYDPAAWAFHPGLDHLITLEDLAEEAKPSNNSLGAWQRNYLNLWTERSDTVIDLETWDTRHNSKQAPPIPETVAHAYDVALDRSQASVWAAWRDEDGVLQLHVVEAAPGTTWLAEYVARLHSTGQAALIAADDGGPTRHTTDQLTRAGIPVRTLTGRDASTAWTALKAAVRDGPLEHDGSPVLRAALEVAAERRTGDATALSRTHSSGPIDALVAATTAAWFADRITPSIQLF